MIDTGQAERDLIVTVLTTRNEVDKVMPDCRERKEWLKKHGAGLDL